VIVVANMLQVFGTNKRRALDEWTIGSEEDSLEWFGTAIKILGFVLALTAEFLLG